MGWLRRNFDGLDEDSTEVQREQHARAYILQIIEGELCWGSAVLATLYRETRQATQPRKIKISGYMLLLWNHGSSYARLPNELRDIRLLLDQRSKVEMPYENPTIQECIPLKFLVNPNIWHVKVPLVVYATVEMQVLQQFGFRQSIPVAFQDIDDLHPIDLRGRTDENLVELACDPEYMQWFRVYSKPYLLEEEARSWQPHTRRPRRAPIHPRSSEMGPSSAPIQEPTSMATLPLGQYVSSYSGGQLRSSGTGGNMFLHMSYMFSSLQTLSIKLMGSKR
ncbi:hypothetical protein Godav_006518 [Gossypium davidsonii]|uniref:Aminotransferase-like plant mobile domain-containing protein n=1 Tax=Gossypium davidsonii TaxID=34287 RepID=A0A7J8S495_GOSDV|nr:hypothetical protein [Gossypium davidsonii]